MGGEGGRERVGWSDEEVIGEFDPSCRVMMRGGGGRRRTAADGGRFRCEGGAIVVVPPSSTLPNDGDVPPPPFHHPLIGTQMMKGCRAEEEVDVYDPEERVGVIG